MAPALQAEFGFNNAAAGLLTTGIFLSHAMMQLPGGRLSDRLGPVRLMTLALLWIAVGNVALAFAGAYWQLLTWKTFVGVGTGLCFTAGARYLVSLFAGRDLHLAQGLYGGSIMLGSGFVIFAVPRFAAATGWRGAFLASAAVAGLTWLWWLAGAPRAPRTQHAAGSFQEMMRSGALWWLGLVQMASFGLMVVAGTWIATLLRARFGMTPAAAGLAGSAVLLLGIVSRPAGGWMVSRIPLRTLVRSSMLINAAACAALAMGGWPGLTIAAIAALGIGCGLPYASVFSRAAALFPARAGAAMGLVNLVGILMVLVGAPAVGFLADRTGDFRVGFLLFAGVAFVAALCAGKVAEER